ncbi:MAG: hypothetical protein MZW92_73635 [Comamonadaceae bacterium]|nr:hypothetical protein [Comamonadaceae bacterium]
MAMHLLQDIALAGHPAPAGARAAPRAQARRHAAAGASRPRSRPVDAYRRGDAGYFYVPDEHARDVGAKLCTQIVRYGSVRTPFTFGSARELLENAGWREVRRCAFGPHHASRWPEIASLDNRERESLFVEGDAA